MSNSIMMDKLNRSHRNFVLRSFLIIPLFAAGVGAMVGFTAPYFFQLSLEDSLGWSITGAVSALVLVLISLGFVLQPRSNA